jgi:single-strand DNA-binding protein
MASFNKVILIGNLTRDPELRYTPSGRAIAKIGIAVNRSWKSESGEAREEVTYVDVDAFGRQAEVIGQYLKRGRPIMIEGRLRLDQWEDKQSGQKRSRLGVVMESFQFLDSGSNRGDADGHGGGKGSQDFEGSSHPAPHTKRASQAPSAGMDDDFDPPF